MSEKFDLKASEHLGSSEGKKHFNEEHFAESAVHYDFVTQVLSFGQDYVWKHYLVEGLDLVESPFCLDIACGTGDITFLLAERFPGGEILGADLTQEMLDLAENRNITSHVSFSKQDMNHLELADNSVDILTGGYAIRNAPDLGETLDEFRRVLKPGGQMAFLDFSRPVAKPLQFIQYWAMKIWGGLWGLLLHGNPEVHGYISASLLAYPDMKKLEAIFLDHGFKIERSRGFLSGMTRVYFLKSTVGT